MKISITLPSIYPDALARTIDNIERTTRNDHEIIVVSPFPVRGKNVLWLEERERRGPTFAHTAAASRATGDFITAGSDDCVYPPDWDALAVENYFRRKPATDRIFCLGLHYGLVGTVFGVYYPNFPFMRRQDAAEIDYFDGNYGRGFGDSDLGLKVWSAGGRCEFTALKLIEITEEDRRKGGETCPTEDLQYFLRRWAVRYGQDFDVSHMRSFNVDFDPERHPELVSDWTVHDNVPEFVNRAKALSPPHLVESTLEWNIVWFRGAVYALPRSTGPIDLEKEADRDRACKQGGTVFATIGQARAHALAAELARAREAATAPPCLLDKRGTLNLVGYAGQFYVVPQSLGPLDLALPESRSQEGVVCFATIDEAIAHCERAQDRQ